MYPRNKCSWNKGALKALAGGEDGLKGLAEGMSSGGEGWQKMV